jgi:hypothetical protein
MGANVPAVTAKRGRHRRCTATRNKPSFTLDAAEGGTRVRPILVPVSPWSGACACHGIEQGHVQRDI